MNWVKVEDLRENYALIAQVAVPCPFRLGVHRKVPPFGAGPGAVTAAPRPFVLTARKLGRVSDVNRFYRDGIDVTVLTDRRGRLREAG